MAVKDRRQLTSEERALRRERDREYARQAVETLRSSQGWQAWLTTRASFHSYCWLIWISRRRRCVVLRPLSSATCRRRQSSPKMPLRLGSRGLTRGRDRSRCRLRQPSALVGAV
jgi:hypothetical protein